MSRQIEYRDALREAMSEEMRRDPRVFLMGEEVAEYNGAYKVSRGMLEEFGPQRVIDTPISETGFTGLAVGAAMMGLRPIIEFMSWSFSLVAADQILNNAPKMLYMSGGQFGCPMVFRGNNGAGGQLGSTHSWSVESLYANVPGLKMAIPFDPYDAKGLLKTAVRDDNPVFPAVPGSARFLLALPEQPDPWLLPPPPDWWQRTPAALMGRPLRPRYGGL